MFLTILCKTQIQPKSYNYFYYLDDSTATIRCNLGEVPTELILYHDGLTFPKYKNKYMKLVVKLSAQLLLCNQSFAFARLERGLSEAKPSSAATG